MVLCLLAGCSPRAAEKPEAGLEVLLAESKIKYPEARARLLSTPGAADWLTGLLRREDYPTVDRALSLLAYGFGPDRTDHGRAFVRRVLPAVVACLSHTNLAVRSHALWLVGDLGENAAPAVDELLRVAQRPRQPGEENFVIRSAAIRSLGLIAAESDRCLPVLQALLREPDVETRRFAVEAVGRFESAAAGCRSDLETLAGDPNADLARAAKEALERLQLPPRPKAGSLAPDLVALRVNGAGRFDLRELRGSFVYLDFWATTCPPCIEPLGVADRLAREAASDPRLGRVRFVSVSLDATPEVARRFLGERGWTHAAHVMGTDAITRVYRVGGIPDALLVDPDGRILWRGNPHGMDLRRKVESLVP